MRRSRRGGAVDIDDEAEEQREHDAAADPRDRRTEGEDAEAGGQDDDDAAGGAEPDGVHGDPAAPDSVGQRRQQDGGDDRDEGLDGEHLGDQADADVKVGGDQVWDRPVG
jgi:hypothetical protein